MENSNDDEVPFGSCAHAQGLLTVDEIIARLSPFTVQQRSLAWSPQPPFESAGAHDCRVGGSCGLEFNWELPRARWIQARHRWNREQKAFQDALSSPG
jgi:hypothetical protein